MEATQSATDCGRLRTQVRTGLILFRVLTVFVAMKIRDSAASHASAAGRVIWRALAVVSTLALLAAVAPLFFGPHTTSWNGAILLLRFVQAAAVALPLAAAATMVEIDARSHKRDKRFALLAVPGIVATALAFVLAGVVEPSLQTLAQQQLGPLRRFAAGSTSNAEPQSVQARRPAGVGAAGEQHERLALVSAPVTLSILAAVLLRFEQRRRATVVGIYAVLFLAAAVQVATTSLGRLTGRGLAEGLAVVAWIPNLLVVAVAAVAHAARPRRLRADDVIRR